MAYHPVIGGSANVKFPLQFPRATVDRLSLAVTPIEHLANDGSFAVVAHATGFFWRHRGKLYLVTARHVLNGRDPFTDELMSETGFIPRYIRIFPTISHGLVDSRIDRSERANGILVDLGDPDEPAWIGDPEFDELRTDIAVVDTKIDDDRLISLNQSDMQFQPVVTAIGFECSVLGYPTANTGGVQTPVWRRATIASEPGLPVDDKPMFLLDAATSPGFSGAPVIRRHIGPAPFQKADGSFEIRVENIVTVDFVGVYAGRLKNRHLNGEVAFAFYANRLNAIFK